MLRNMHTEYQKFGKQSNYQILALKGHSFTQKSRQFYVRLLAQEKKK